MSDIQTIAQQPAKITKVLPIPNEGKNRMPISEFTEFFQKADTDQNGKLTLTELNNSKSLGTQKYAEQRNVLFSFWGRLAEGPQYRDTAAGKQLFSSEAVAQRKEELKGIGLEPYVSANKDHLTLKSIQAVSSIDGNPEDLSVYDLGSRKYLNLDAYKNTLNNEYAHPCVEYVRTEYYKPGTEGPVSFLPRTSDDN